MAASPKSVDWANILDFSLASANVTTELFGDWYRDPWGWPEIAWLATSDGVPHLVRRLNASDVRRSSRIDVAKENFGTRPAVVLDAADRVVYQALVFLHSVKMGSDLSPFVHGWRLSRKSAVRGKWMDNGEEHERFRSQLSALSGHYDALLKTDIVSCFSSISVERVRDVLFESLGSGAPVGRLVSMLEAWQAIPSRSGLPQRSSASAALANFFLRPIDEVLVRHGKARGVGALTFKDGTALRWMDDVWFFSNSTSKLREAQVRLQDALRSLGLEMNHSKTEVLEGADAEEEAKAVRHSAVDRIGLGATQFGCIGGPH